MLCGAASFLKAVCRYTVLLRGTKVLLPQNMPFGIFIQNWLFRNQRLRKNL